MRIALDIDGVLCNFNKAYAALLAQELGEDLLPVGWAENQECFHCWDWDTAHGYSPAVQKVVWTQRIWANDKFWAKLDPLPGATDVLRQLNWRMKDGKIDCYFVTNRSGEKAKKQTEWWLYDKGSIDYPTVLLASDKVPILKALDVSFFADDKLETVVQASTYKVPTYLIDAPWNRQGRPELLVAKNVREALEKAGVL